MQRTLGISQTIRCQQSIQKGDIKSVYLLLPALNFLQEEVISLCDLLELGVHTPLEIDEVLPRLHSITGVLVPLPDNLVKMAH